MTTRPPTDEALVFVDVARPVRVRRLEYCAEDAVLSRQRAKRRDQFVAHPGGEEASETSVAVRQTERGVARARKLARAVHEPLEYFLDGQLLRNRKHGVANCLQRWAQRLCHPFD